MQVTAQVAGLLKTGDYMDEASGGMEYGLLLSGNDGKALMKEFDDLEAEMRGWRDVVRQCERLLHYPDTAETPLSSNLPNLVRDALMKRREA